MPSNKVHYLLWPASFKLDGGAMFGIIPKPLWNKVHPSDEQNRIDLALRLWMIKSDKHLVVMDTGIGDYHDQKFQTNFDVRSPSGPLKEALDKIGHTPDDVTDLIISHLHFDHVGGIGEMKNGVMGAVFKNARLHLHKDHYQYALHPSERDAGSFHTHNFAPVIKYYKDENRIVWHQGEEGDLITEIGLKFKTSQGHTPHLMHPYDENFIYLADLIPTANHIHIPWVMGYDISPGVTTMDKRKFLEFMIEKNLTGIFEHDPKSWGAKVTCDEKGRYQAVKLQAATSELLSEIQPPSI